MLEGIFGRGEDAGIHLPDKDASAVSVAASISECAQGAA